MPIFSKLTSLWPWSDKETEEASRKIRDAAVRGLQQTIDESELLASGISTPFYRAFAGEIEKRLQTTLSGVGSVKPEDLPVLQASKKELEYVLSIVPNAQTRTKTAREKLAALKSQEPKI